MPAAGTMLGPYKILAPLGSGGMGEVYRARDTRLDRDVAIKVISAGLARDPERIRRFEQEARAAGALNHPNVCIIPDLGIHGGSPFVVMELLEGESLRAKLEAGSIPGRKVIDYAARAAHGPAAAHEKGIVHRDLKPENLSVTKARSVPPSADFDGVGEETTMRGFVGNIEDMTTENSKFRRVLYTGRTLQLVLMVIQPREDIGEEVHPDRDQFFRVESGKGEAWIDGHMTEIKSTSAVLVPAGALHNIKNTGEKPLKLYTLYGPPEHADGTVRATKAEAMASEEHFDGRTTE
jgi:serine/threonine protein kinase